eukprot:5761686-Alexandrium_andersonii.AAC.1
MPLGAYGPLRSFGGCCARRGVTIAARGLWPSSPWPGRECNRKLTWPFTGGGLWLAPGDVWL